MFIVGGDNVRITGLQLEGEMYPQDYGNGDVYPGSVNERYYLQKGHSTFGSSLGMCLLIHYFQGLETHHFSRTHI